jgi:PEP-CTERM motif
VKFNTSRRLLAVAAFIGVAGLLSAGAARADMVTYTTTIPLQTAPAPFSYGFTESQFNPALGTLTGVSIALDSTITPGVNVFGVGTLPNPYTAAMATDMVVLTAPTADGNITQSASTGSYSGTITANYPTITTYFASSPTTANNTATVLAANFPTYVGLGLLNFTFASGVSSDSISGTNVFVGGAETASATATVTYTYTPAAPEPGSLGLLAIGGIGFLINRRKKA